MLPLYFLKRYSRKLHGVWTEQFAGGFAIAVFE
jgi:hypothetical protein